jgi:hypothetical protein
MATKITVLAGDPFMGWEVRTEFVPTGANRYQITCYGNGRRTGRQLREVPRPLTWQEVLRHAGRLATMKLEGDLRYAVEVSGVRRKWQQELITGKMLLDTDWRLPEIVAMLAGWPERDLLVLRRRYGSLLRTELLEAMTRIFDTDLAPAPGSLAALRAAAGVGERAAALERKIRGELAAMEKRHAGQAPKKLLFVIGRTPGRLDGLIAVGKGSYLNELMRAAGGRNVLADSPVAYPKISLEGVLRLAPDVIVDMGEMAATVGVTEAQKRAVERLWRERTGVKAKVVAVAADIFVVPGPRVAEAAAAFEAMLR